MLNRYQIIYVCFLLNAEHFSAQTIDTDGKIIIGQDVNDTTSLYTFNENYVNQFEIPILLTIINTTTGETLPDLPSGPVRINCETSLPTFGYTQATFVSRVVSQPSTTINFITPVPGRPVDLRCWGESTSGDEFTKDVSLSDPVSFYVRKAGTVSLSKSVISVANEPDTVSVEGTFLVELSEDVENFNVTITCDLDDTGVVNPMSLSFTPQLVITGFRKSLIPYSLLSGGDPVTVFCTARSDTGNNQQFDPATSTGSNATFVLADGSVRLIPDRATIKTTQLYTYLVLDAPPTTEVIFACYLRKADNFTHAESFAANPICQLPDNVSPTRPPTNAPGVTDLTAQTTPPGPTTPAPPTPTQPTNLTGEWGLQQQVIIFESGSDLYRRVVLERSLNVDTPTNQILVVTCCAPNTDNDSPKYENQSTALIVDTYLTPYYSINWNNATLLADSEVETVIPDPAFVEVSPCPCDLIEATCDTDCCCDTDCSADDILTFECLPGIYGGNTSVPPRYMCNAKYPNKPDWFNIMCVQWNNSAFLGYFYNPEPALRDDAQYDDIATTNRPEHDYEETEDRFPGETTSSTFGYQEGRSVRTGLAMSTVFEDYYQGESYKLTLPTPSLSGACVWSSPVPALRDTQHSCTWRVSEDLCAPYTPLSSLIYAQSSRWAGAKGPVVLAVPGLSEVVDTNVDFLCAGSDEGYVRSTETIESLGTGQSVLFDYDIPPEEECYFDAYSGAYVCSDQEVVVFEDIPPARCDWDDGFTRPPSPQLQGDVCTNAVLQVVYNFTWQATQLLTLNATVILGDLSLTSPTPTEVDNATYLTQNFEVMFTHQLSDVPVTDSNDTETNDTYVRPTTTQQYQRSGNPGYEFGLPLLSGVAVYNTNLTEDTNSTSNGTEPDQFLYVDANTTNTLSVWSAGADSLCLTADRRSVDFGIDTFWSCMVKLGLENLSDCQTLRRLVLNRQDAMMPSSLISRGGDPDYLYLQDWANVYREDISYILDNTTDDMTTAVPLTTVTTATTVAVTTATEASNSSSLGQLDSLIGRCENIPDGIHVDVMYAVAGQRDGKPFHQIVGAKISYTLSTWRLPCAGPDSLVCYNNASWVQDILEAGGDATESFTLTSSVRYLQVPASDPKPRTKYEEDNKPLVWKCYQDSCWREIFYPFMARNPGDDPQYTLAMGLTFLIAAIGGFLIVRPASRWDYIYPQL